MTTMFVAHQSIAVGKGLGHMVTALCNHGNKCLYRRNLTSHKCIAQWSTSSYQKMSSSYFAAKWNKEGDVRCKRTMLNKNTSEIYRSHQERALSGSCWRSHPRGTLQMDLMKEQKQKTVAKNKPVYEEETTEESASVEETDEDVAVVFDDPQMSHTPVMLKEVVEFMEPKDNQVFLDLTFGAGGHTEAILQQCDTCRVIALDRDPVAHDLAIAMAEKYGHDRLTPLLGRFSEVSALLRKKNIPPGSLDGVLIDAGCSSMQFNSAERGFALSKEGPLDMRMDGNRIENQPSAADVVNSIDAPTLANILNTYGEESKAKKIARMISDYREKYGQIKTTQELKTVISFAFTHREANRHRDGIGRRSHVATKTFMALRIFVNNELQELSAGLKQVEGFVKTGGKLAVLSFHSMEDRIVKRFLQGRDVAEKATTLRQKKAAACDDEEFGERTEVTLLWDMRKELQLPSKDEIETNPRSRSAKMRTAVKCANSTD